jgi:hypothetical protein
VAAGEVDAVSAESQQLAGAEPGANQAKEMIAVRRQARGEQAPELVGGVGPPLGSAEAGVGVDGRLGRRDLGDRVAVDAAVVLGRLEDAMQERPACHHRLVAERCAQLVLPAADCRDIDGAKLPLPEERQQMEAQPAFCRFQGGRAAVRVSRPHLPPLARPLLKRLLAEAGVDPAPASELGEQVVLEVAGGVAGGEGLAALAAVVQPPPDLVAAGRGLADARGCHRFLLLSRGQRSAASPLSVATIRCGGSG